MNPSDLALPTRYTDFRPGQLETAAAVHASDSRVVVVGAPTGSGKSLIAAAVHRLEGGRTLVLTGTRALQDQYRECFEEMGMVDVRGRRNYRCVAFDPGEIFDGVEPRGSSCDVGPCRVGERCPYKFSTDPVTGETGGPAGCLYFDRLLEARKADIVVTNYAWWLAMGRAGMGDAIGRFDVLVCDEAHTAHDWLTRFSTIELYRRDFERIGRELPRVAQDEWAVEEWEEWVGKAIPEVRRAKSIANMSGRDVRWRIRIEHIYRDITELGRELSAKWVVRRTPKSWTFAPVWPRKYAEPVLFRGIGRVVLASATATRRTPHYLGVGKREFEYLEAGDGFDVARRPVYYLDQQPEIRVQWDMHDGMKLLWVKRMERVAKAREGKRGIIQTRSYKRGKEILERMGPETRARMIVPRTGSELAAAVEKYRATPGAILASAALEEGHDFPYEECEWQIIAKVPFLDKREPLTAARCESEPQYAHDETAQAVVQMAGRGMRAADDWCEVFVVDRHWRWFERKTRKAGGWPGWFERACRETDVVPTPPEGRS